MKIAIIYFSESGNTEKAAKYIAEGAESTGNTEVRLFNIKNNDLDKAYIESCGAVFFGTPTYCGNMCWQMKKWIDTDFSIRFADKLGAAFSTENNPVGGGAELAIMTLHNHLLVKGMLVYSSGTAYGKPYIHIGPALPKDEIDQYKDICVLFGQRVANKAKELFEK